MHRSFGIPSKLAIWGSRAVLMLAGYYLFLVICFYANSLGHYSYAAISAQQTPNATDFPFSGSPNLGIFGFAFLIIAILVSGFGILLLPFALVALGLLLIPYWHHLQRAERIVWILALTLGLTAFGIMYSPLGRAIFRWIED